MGTRFEILAVVLAISSRGGYLRHRGEVLDATIVHNAGRNYGNRFCSVWINYGSNHF